ERGILNVLHAEALLAPPSKAAVTCSSFSESIVTGRPPRRPRRFAASRAVFDHSESSLRGAKRRSNPGDRRSAAVALDCFASLAMTVAYRLDRKALSGISI